MTRGFDKCIGKMKEAAGKINGQEVINDKQAVKILKALAEERKSQKSAGIDNPDIAFLDKVEKMVAAEQTAAIIEKRNHVLNHLRKQEFYGYASKFDNDYDALQAFLAGINKPVEGARLSVASRKQSLFAEYLKGGILTQLERENLLPHFQDKKNGRDLAIELFELDMEAGNPGKTGNSAAVKMAKIIKKVQDDLVTRQNAAGAWIQKLPGYITSQSHDMEKVRKATYEEWRDFIVPKLDLDKTFELVPTDKWDEMLQESYKGIITGLHMRPAGGAEADGLVAFKGPGSIGRKASEHRVFHFSSPENWVDYNERFGVGTVQGSIIKGVDRAVHNLALMEKMGPNPEAFYQTIKEELLVKNKTDTKLFDAISGKRLQQNIPFGEASPDHIWAELNGHDKGVQSLTGARIGQGVRQWINMVSLGGSIFSQLPDIAAKASELRYQGRHPLEGYRQAITDVFAGIGTEDQRIVGHALGAGFEGTLHESIGRFMVDDQLPGKLTDMTMMFFKLNLMEYWNEAQKLGLARAMSSFLAESSSKNFDQLHPRTSEVMKLYNITPEDWDVIRTAKTKIGDYTYILPELIEDQVLRTKFLEYMTDRVDFGVLTPGVRENAIVKRGTQAGTWEGELFRFMGQFKMFSISAITKLMDREVNGIGTKSSKVSSIVQLMTGATVLGYMAMTAKDAVKGKKPRPLEDPRTWKAALLQGGGLGIYGDFMFGEYDRYGAGLTATMAGPALSRIDPIGRMYSQAMKGELKGGDVFQFAKNNTPYLNLFYLRSALDYLFLYDLQEQMDPGFLQRMERRTIEQQGQEFFLPPSQVVGQ